jgi:hypothetical protein
VKGNRGRDDAARKAPNARRIGLKRGLAPLCGTKHKGRKKHEHPQPSSSVSCCCLLMWAYSYSLALFRWTILPPTQHNLSTVLLLLPLLTCVYICAAALDAAVIELGFFFSWCCCWCFCELRPLTHSPIIQKSATYICVFLFCCLRYLLFLSSHFSFSPSRTQTNKQTSARISLISLRRCRVFNFESFSLLVRVRAPVFTSPALSLSLSRVRTTQHTVLLVSRDKAPRTARSSEAGTALSEPQEEKKGKNVSLP